MNRDEAGQKAISAADRCLKNKGYISMVDVLMEMKKLTREDYEGWRFGKVPYLEKVVQGNLKQLEVILRAVRNNSLKGKLKSSYTAYYSWGKGARRPLRFSKTGNPFIEEVYSTHYLLPQERKKPMNKVTEAPPGEEKSQAESGPDPGEPLPF